MKNSEQYKNKELFCCPMNNFYEVYSENGYEIKIKNITNTNSSYILEFTVNENDKTISIYRVPYTITKKPSVRIVNKYIKTFLENPEIRSKYKHFGKEFDTKIKYRNDNGVNVKCDEAITKLNTCNIDSDYMNLSVLRTYGHDSFTRMNEIKLIEFIGIDNAKYINEVTSKTICDNYYDGDSVVKHYDEVIRTAYRWKARGLNVELAIMKAIISYDHDKNA